MLPPSRTDFSLLLFAWTRRPKPDRQNTLREKVDYFVIPSEARNLSSILCHEKKSDSSLRSE
jgi:hypothetical protein